MTAFANLRRVGTLIVEHTTTNGSRAGVGETGGASVHASLRHPLVTRPVDTRDLAGLARDRRSQRAGNFDMGAVEEHLEGRGAVQADVLDAEQVLAVGHGGRDRDVEGALAVGTPVEGVS